MNEEDKNLALKMITCWEKFYMEVKNSNKRDECYNMNNVTYDL